jgi:Mg/Co/Ni transporter MgtE
MQDRANILSTMDPSKVSAMMALMPADEAVALLAAVSDVSLAVVSKMLPNHERERLLQVCGVPGSSEMIA